MWVIVATSSTTYGRRRCGLPPIRCLRQACGRRPALSDGALDMERTLVNNNLRRCGYVAAVSGGLVLLAGNATAFAESPDLGSSDTPKKLTAEQSSKYQGKKEDSDWSQAKGSDLAKYHQDKPGQHKPGDWHQD